MMCFLGNHYFPPNSIKPEFFLSNSHQTTCQWKGIASYNDVMVNGDVNRNAAWYYQNQKPAANYIREFVAFWQGIQVTK
jgi:uncharacterized protein (DUF427 family)